MKGDKVVKTGSPDREFMIGYILGRKQFPWKQDLFRACLYYEGKFGSIIKMISNYVIKFENK